MAGSEITPQTADLKFKQAVINRINYKLDHNEETPLGGLNPYHPYYDNSGQELFIILRDHLNLKKSDNVLDIGCGTGRIAKPLISYIGNNYYGMDNNRLFIEYCVENFKKGTFNHHDMFHPDWNPLGTLDPEINWFPQANDKFDKVISFAVFNHFRMRWMKVYFKNIARVMKKGGKLFMSLIIAKEPIDRTEPPFKFDHRNDQELEWYDFEDRPLLNVALDEKCIRRYMMKSGLMINEPIRYGSWNKSPLAVTAYDVIIATKR